MEEFLWADSAAARSLYPDMYSVCSPVRFCCRRVANSWPLMPGMSMFVMSFRAIVRLNYGVATRFQKLFCHFTDIVFVLGKQNCFRPSRDLRGKVG
jgi:hypothetical protein